MEQLPTWLAAAIDAAGVCTVYNADDWIVMTGPDSDSAEPPFADPHPTSH